MKIYTWYLRGTKINGQFTCRPKWFVFYFGKYRGVIRVWRLQIGFDYN